MAAGDGAEGAGLAETIEILRAELRTAQDAGTDSDVRFTVGPVEVELAIEVTKKAGGEASIKVLNLLSIGGQGERAKSETNRVKVTLQPVARNGVSFEVAAANRHRPDGSPAGNGSAG